MDRIRRRVGSRRPVWAAILVFGLLAGACGDDDDPGSATTGDTSVRTTTGGGAGTETETTIIIDGQAYTCEDVLGDAIEGPECSEGVQEAFDLYGANIDAFVNSGQLGPWNSEEFSYAEVALNGLDACRIRDAGGNEQDFVEIVGADYPDMGGTELLPLWFEALQTLCP